MGKKKKEIIQLDRESVIPIIKPKLIHGLANLIDNSSDKQEFYTFCKRVEYTIRAWYLVQFEEMMHLYNLFEPVMGARKLEERDLSEEEINELEQKFVGYLFQMMEKSNFKIVSNQEIEVALSGTYCVNLPIKVDEAKLDSVLLRRYFAKNPRDHLPYFADQYIIFRRGFGLDQMTEYFITWKIDAIISRIWQGLLRLTGLRRFFARKRRAKYVIDGEQPTGSAFAYEEEEDDDGDEQDLFIERIRIQNMKLSLGQLISKTTIQEPTFERIIIVYRLQASEGDGRAIYVKHFKNIPMADMEIVLPEKKNPGLTPLDWVKFLASAAIGLLTIITQLAKAKANIKVLATIGSGVVGYCAKTYFTFDKNLKDYQNLITRSMYDKQLDSGRGTLLHLCDDVIQQEVKEVIISFFVLMIYGSFTSQDLDRKCEELILEEFKENCNFDVDDAVAKLEKLGLVSKDENQRYKCVDVTKANDIIGTTTEEVVTKANQGSQ
ncbi:uncharacterized protein LOC141643799 isoform X2 [Silene latifolia]|uniref:uncharacterized protein LOC141643799 isoform X2 n=1 Tax=Silene latifolia TaxID=37657 RepID=UPI003D789CE3